MTLVATLNKSKTKKTFSQIARGKLNVFSDIQRHTGKEIQLLRYQNDLATFSFCILIEIKAIVFQTELLAIEEGMAFRFPP